VEAGGPVQRGTAPARSGMLPEPMLIRSPCVRPAARSYLDAGIFQAKFTGQTSRVWRAAHSLRKPWRQHAQERGRVANVLIGHEARGRRAQRLAALAVHEGAEAQAACGGVHVHLG
jgi:hypothetical protein